MSVLVLIPLWALMAATHTQVWSADSCTCEITNLEQMFPHDKLSSAERDAARCNGDVTKQKATELDSLMLGLEIRLPQLLADLRMLEQEDDGELYGALSLQVIENELTELTMLINKLNVVTERHRGLVTQSNQQLQDLQAEMKQMEIYDTMQVVKRQQTNQRLKRDLAQCRTSEDHPTTMPTQPAHGVCPHGQFVNVTRPRVYTAGEYPGSYKYGAWGRDPKPAAGKESWYWMVMLTSGNKYGHYVRQYSTLSALIVGVSVPGNVQISPSNPTTNTIQGPNVVLYGDALYYNCYNKDAVCRFNLTDKTVSAEQLPQGTRFNSKGNFCHLDECYLYTDLDLATDESGVWVMYTSTQDYGNLVLSKVEEGAPPTLSQTWRTSLYKQAATNTFMICGVLYATRFVSKDTEEIFYSFDTATGEERFNVGINIAKMSTNIYSLNYSPADQMLHAYSDAYMVSYKVLFM
ncbi:olfactomedin-4-like [Genypterus blacodes]|uniref:olfactomedin-4-like n=1 Tax=Genypterus blacodes TaxID=154954 RepID=UPI003F75B78F